MHDPVGTERDFRRDRKDTPLVGVAFYSAFVICVLISLGLMVLGYPG